MTMGTGINKVAKIAGRLLVVSLPAASFSSAAPAAESGQGPRYACEREMARASSAYGVPLGDSRGQRVLYPGRDQYVKVVKALLDDTFTMCSDLTAVDYLQFPNRTLPAGVAAERFEVVVNLLSVERRERIRLRVQVPADDARVPTLFDLGYLGLSSRYELQVSARLRSDWGNGKEFYELAGRPIHVPGQRGNRPDQSAIEWHLDSVFLR